MKLARAIHFDESDMRVYHSPARTGEWCISGGFEFSNWGEGDLVGKARQAFSNGWLGLETYGRATFVAVTQIEPDEAETVTRALAQHFVAVYGAPNLDAALPVARDEVAQMADLCDEHPANTLLTVMRDLSEAGVRESYSTIAPQGAELDLVAVHGALDE